MKKDFEVPIIPLINTIVLPKTLTPILIGRDFSKKAVDLALTLEGKVLCIPQIAELFEDTLSTSLLYRIGTVCKIIQVFPLPDGNLRVLMEGVKRVKVVRYKNNKKENYLSAKVTDLPQNILATELEVDAITRSVKKIFKEYSELTNIPKDAIKAIYEKEDVLDLFYVILGNSLLDYQTKQKIIRYLVQKGFKYDEFGCVLSDFFL